MRHEGDGAADALLDLRAVTMVEDAIRRHAAVALGKMRPFGRRFARARNAGLGVDHDVSAGREDAGVSERRKREQRSRRITARIGNKPSDRNRLALALGQAIRHAVGQPVGFRIPPGALGGVTQAERAGKVDDADTGSREIDRLPGRGRVRQRQKNDLGLAGEKFAVERLDVAAPHTRQRGQGASSRRTAR